MKQITNNIVEIPNMKHGFLKEENQTVKKLYQEAITKFLEE